MNARETAEALLNGAADEEVPAAAAPLLAALGIGWALLAIADRLAPPAAPPEEEPEPEIPHTPRYLGDD